MASVLALQRSAGNAATAQLLTSRPVVARKLGYVGYMSTGDSWVLWNTRWREGAEADWATITGLEAKIRAALETSSGPEAESVRKGLAELEATKIPRSKAGETIKKLEGWLKTLTPEKAPEKTVAKPPAPPTLEQRVKALNKRPRAAVNKDPETKAWFDGFTAGMTLEDINKLSLQDVSTWKGERPASPPVEAKQEKKEKEVGQAAEEQEQQEEQADPHQALVDRFVTRGLNAEKAAVVLRAVKAEGQLANLETILEIELSDQQKISNARWKKYLGLPTAKTFPHVGRANTDRGLQNIHMSLFPNAFLRVEVPTLEGNSVEHVVAKILNFGSPDELRIHTTLEYFGRADRGNPHWYIGEARPKKKSYTGPESDLEPMKTALQTKIDEVTVKVRAAKDAVGDPAKVADLPPA